MLTNYQGTKPLREVRIKEKLCWYCTFFETEMIARSSSHTFDNNKIDNIVIESGGTE